MRGLGPCGESSILSIETKINVTVAQLVELEPAHGEGPNAAGKTKPMVRVHPVAPSLGVRLETGKL